MTRTEHELGTQQLKKALIAVSRQDGMPVVQGMAKDKPGRSDKMRRGVCLQAVASSKGDDAATMKSYVLWAATGGEYR